MYVCRVIWTRQCRYRRRQLPYVVVFMGSSESLFDESDSDEESEEYDARDVMSRAPLFERLCDFYDAFNPAIFQKWGNGHLWEIAREYSAQEQALWNALYAKYSVPHQDQIWHCCDLGGSAGLTEEERAAMASAGAEEVASNRNLLFASPHPMQSRAQTSAARLHARLVLMYNDKCPEKVEDAKALAAMYHDEVPKLVDAVRSKYGVELMDAAYEPPIAKLTSAMSAVGAMRSAGNARAKRRKRRPWRWMRGASQLKRRASRQKASTVAPAGSAAGAASEPEIDAAHLAAIESTFDVEAQARERALFVEKSKRKRMLERRLAKRRKKAAAGSTADAAVTEVVDDETHAQIDLLTNEAASAKVAATKAVEASRAVCLARLEKRLQIRLERL